MSSEAETVSARLPKRARGRKRVTELLRAAAAVFAEKGYEAATMTEIAARAGAPIGSLYQFFPAKEALADSVLQSYFELLSADLQSLTADARGIDTRALVERLFTLLRAHPRERAAALPVAEARMDARTRRNTFRPMLRQRIAAVLRAREPALAVAAAREMSVVLLQLMKAVDSLSDEDTLPVRVAAIRELQALAVQYLDQRLAARAETRQKA
jgi:AcrR family transcriptional regulator